MSRRIPVPGARVRPMPGRRGQRGIAMLGITLAVLVAMTLMTAIGARMAVNSQRLAANTVHSDAAFQVTDAGLDNTLAYLNHNRKYVSSPDADGWFNAGSSPQWIACNVADLSPPCGDGSSNLYGTDWLAYGPVPNLQSASADYSTVVYLLSDNINDPPVDQPWLGCLNLLGLSIVPTNKVSKLVTINAALSLIGLGLPSDFCLPLHFEGSDSPPAPSSSNPTLRALAMANNSVDLRGGSARLQQDLQTTSRFAWDPMAPLMVHGTPHLAGSVRVWGNPRPPSRPPYDWSILDLNDVAGLNVTASLGTHLSSQAGSLASLLNLTEADVLALDWNVTFPLAIWSDESASFSDSMVGLNFNNGGRTCLPQFDNVANSTCLPLSFQSVGPGLTLKLPDVQDEHNLLSTVANLIDTSPEVDFPDDLFEHIFGVAEVDAAQVKQDATVINNCNNLDGAPGGLYWVVNNCGISNTVGTATDPVVLIAEGTVTMSAGSEFWGVLFMLGGSHRNFYGNTSGLRATVFGALLSNHTVHLRNRLNVVYNNDVVRRAGYRSGPFARLPGGWTDEFSGP